MKVIPETQSAH